MADTWSHAGALAESVFTCFSAAGDPEITIYNDALVYADGTVVFKPPAIYKSFCSVRELQILSVSSVCKKMRLL